MGSKVHEQLYSKLDKAGLEQTIYFPLRKQGISKMEKWQNALKNDVVTSTILKSYHRILFRLKIETLFKDIQTKIDLSAYDIIHATTLMSDGALALKIQKKYGIPYMVAVRGTDINLFLKYRWDLNNLAREILLNAKKVIFISASLKQNFFQLQLIKKLGDSINSKCLLIPNGLDPYWLENRTLKRSTQPSNILYVGKFNSNKNVLQLIKAFQLLRKNYPKLKLNLVGKGGSTRKRR